MHSVFLCDLTHTGQKVANDGFPYGIGCLAAYLEENLSHPVKTRLFKFANDLYPAIKAQRPQVVGFANYIWNTHLHTTLAREIKKEFPEITIVCGGPNFPRDREEQEELVRARSMVDFFIEGEGERALTDLVRLLIENDFDRKAVKRVMPPSARFIDQGRFFASELAPRFKTLDEIPSPYLSGKLDPFFELKLMPMIQTNRGCPFTCAYCAEGHPYHGRVAKLHDRKRLAAEIEYIAEKSVGNTLLNIADSNFAMYKEDEETAAILRRSMDERNFPTYIHVATGKNKKDRVLGIAKTLKGRLRLSGSVQSLDPEVLANVKRKRISVAQLIDMALDAREVDANSYSEVILSLPGDTREKHINTMTRLIDAGFNMVVPYTLMLLKGTEVGSKAMREQFGMISKFRILPKCFGGYDFGGRTVYSGEIEEVCVGLDTLTVEDYLDCRMFALTTALFYNDRIFEEALGLLEAFGLSPAAWLAAIHDSISDFSPELKSIYQAFKKDTLDELWNKEEDLENFILDPKNMALFTSGELGFNVLYRYRAKALVEAMAALNSTAFDHALKLIETGRAGVLEKNKAYFEQLSLFSLLRKDRLFDFDYQPRAAFDFDFKSALETEAWAPTDNVRPGAFEYAFESDPKQVEQARAQIEVFGSDLTGLTKVLARIPLNRLYRKVLS